MKRLAIRQPEEAEAREYLANTGQAPPRFVIVDADDPGKAVFTVGGLVIAGAPWIHSAILAAREIEARYLDTVLILTAEQQIVERVGKALDLNEAWPLDRLDDPAVAAAKLEAIGRATIPEAYFLPDRMLARRRERDE